MLVWIAWSRKRTSHSCFATEYRISAVCCMVFITDCCSVCTHTAIKQPRTALSKAVFLMLLRSYHLCSRVRMAPSQHALQRPREGEGRQHLQQQQQHLQVPRLAKRLAGRLHNKQLPGCSSMLLSTHAKSTMYSGTIAQKLPKFSFSFSNAS